MIRALLLPFAVSMGLLVGACGGQDSEDTSATNGMGGMGSMGSEHTLPEVLEVAASEGRFDRAAAPDLDPSPEVVEVELEAKVAEIEIAPGRTLSMWTYNGKLPGPRIEAKLGDTVRVHFKNSLPVATTIHWHGLRVPNAMDGSPSVQAPVTPGAEFTYEFVMPDAGTFWYHPHLRSDEQVERGLYGAIVVRGSEEPETTTEHTVVLDDLLLDEDWHLRAFDSTQAMIGRQGNLVLANGWAHPLVSVERGGLHRFRFINAANARYFRLSLPGHRLIQIGTDGGFMTSPREVDDLLLVPGERADVLVVADGDAGEAVDWRTLHYDRGHGTGDLPDAVIFQMKHDDGVPTATPKVPTGFATISALPEPTRQRKLTLENASSMSEHDHGSESSDKGPTFAINYQDSPDGAPLVAARGDVEEWEIVNATMMDHPFHLHGYRYQLLPSDGEPWVPAWHDTINVPAGQLVKFRVRFEDNPGSWMFHCHILEHAERGMMGELEVTP